jgi:hypothetical protein
MPVAIKAPSPLTQDLMPPGSFVLIGMMRSGSNFLERKLNLLPDIRCHGELFNPKFVGISEDFPEGLAGFKRGDIALRNKSSVRFLKAIAEASDRKHFGFRLFINHSSKMISETLYNPDVKKIVLTRNMLEAYVSLQNALETDIWLITDKQTVKPSVLKVDLEGLLCFALQQSMFYNDILTILHRTGQAFEQIDYTEIKELSRLNELAQFLGSEHRFEKIEEPIKKQATEPLSKRVQDYNELVRELQKRQLARWFI